MPKTIIISGASSGFGAMCARHLADAGHTVYAGMRETADHNRQAVADAAKYAEDHEVDLRTVEMDVSDQMSVDAAVATVLSEAGGLDVVIHNAGHMVLGPTEAFTVAQIAAVYDTNVLSTQRLNRAVLPHLRTQRDGLLVWIGSTSTRGGTPPYLAPYFAAKAAEDSLAVSYAAEIARFGIETTIVVPGSFTTGTNHFANAGHAEDTVVADAYEVLYAGLMDDVASDSTTCRTPPRAQRPTERGDEPSTVRIPPPPRALHRLCGGGSGGAAATVRLAAISRPRSGADGPDAPDGRLGRPARPARDDVLRRHEATPGDRPRADALVARAVPRRADHRPRRSARTSPWPA